MSKYRKVDPRIWNDHKFRALSDNAKLCFFFLLTHPHMTSLGAMRATTSGLAEELGWSAEAFRKAFLEVLQKGMAEQDQEASLIALPNFIRYNPPESPNVVKAWLGSLDFIPECPLRNRVIARAKDFSEGLTEAFARALPEAFAKSMPYQEQEQEQEQEQDKNKRAASPRFDAKKHLVDLGVPDDLATDWMKLRKTKKAEVTKTAIDGVISEADKAGFTLETALRECCTRGWAGFKAAWIERDAANARGSPGYKSIHEQRAETIAGLTGRGRNERADERDITGEAERIA